MNRQCISDHKCYNSVYTRWFSGTTNNNSNDNNSNSNKNKDNSYDTNGNHIYSNKQHKLRSFSYHSFAIPKPAHLKNKKFGKNSSEFGFAGEDSYFTKIFSTKKNTSNGNNGSGPNGPNGPNGVTSKYKSLIIGVADGVGNVKEVERLRSAQFAQELMQESRKFLINIEQDSTNNLLYETINELDCTNNDDSHVYGIAYHDDENSEEKLETIMDGIPQTSLKYSMKNVINNGFRGASTLCTLAFEFPNQNEKHLDKKEPKILHACNLGDSGFAIFRRGLGHRDDITMISQFFADRGDDDNKDGPPGTNGEQAVQSVKDAYDSDVDKDDLTYGEIARKAFESDIATPRIGEPQIRPETDYFMLYRSPTQIKACCLFVVCGFVFVLIVIV